MTRDDIKQQDHFSDIDKKFMKLALKLAKKAELRGEVPIGAVLVDENGQILSQAANLREQLSTVLGHAEIVVLHRACKKLNSWRLNNCTLYVTLEPCFMCAGAITQARLKRVVFAAYDPKGGALGSLCNHSTDSRLNHRYLAEGGLMADESGQLLKKFFKKKREEKKSKK